VPTRVSVVAVSPRAALAALVTVGLMATAVVATAPPATADIDGDSYVSEQHGVRAQLPRGWRITESSGYPRALVWLARSKPRVRIAIVVDPIADECGAGVTFCTHDPAATAAVLRAQLVSAGFEITSQELTRTPELQYQSKRSYLRHAVIIVGDSVVSVILAADSAADRATVGRVFDRLTQSVRPTATGN
jgi:hypothetical protein